MVGIAVVALIAANSSLTRVNGAGAELSTAEFLIEQIRELTDLVAVVDPQSGTSFFGHEEALLSHYDDVDDFDGAIFNPPITSDRQSLNDFEAYTQTVTVENINPSNFDQVVVNHSSDYVRITVSVTLNGQELSSASWIRANY
jgi:hypothetical protein